MSAVRWLFTLAFGGSLAVAAGAIVFAAAIFCIVGALVQSVWRSRRESLVDRLRRKGGL